MTLRRPSLPKIARIDMTPMAGVLICLLVIFFVLTPMGCGGVDVELPLMSNASAREVPDRAENLYIGITYRGQLFFRGKRLEGGLEELTGLLQAHLTESVETAGVAVLKADVATPFQDVRAVMELCRKAGVGSIRLIVDPRVEEDVARGMRIFASLPRL
jgi:biopolymer transport protein ExbD